MPMKLTINRDPKAIHPANLPARIPIVGYITWWLLLEKLNASDFVFGIYWSLVVVSLLLVIITMVMQKRIDIFEK